MNSSFSFSEDTVGFFIVGVVDEEHIAALNDEILEKMQRFGKINLYLEDNGIERFTIPAIVNEILFKIEHADKLNKVVLVTNIKWIKACVAIENLFLPTQIKSFDTDNRIEAMSWIAER
ncbi:STAS/SEC14 domain-containing protein [Rasiella rasia]|uniref:STAS/SEC14 domain-containing protein n=1 Tax=Rasiella rasia TaxID=2744027 RepID=A0A6G6GNS3_9FLAO|nr:STAS/SEC14 domain-containing protein [Rasiella rasia]QIE59351.1 STAS/SEC14 domain-containing protein [Rasiella rasia]